jgi:acetoin utilization protein AcuB
VKRPTGRGRPSAAELLTEPVLAVPPGMDVRSGLRIMHRHHTRHLPVVEGRHCVALVDEADLLTALLGEQVDLLLAVGMVGRRPAPSVHRSADRAEIAATMLAEDTDALIVLDGTEVVGLVTAFDLVRSLAVEAGARRVPGQRGGGPP